MSSDATVAAVDLGASGGRVLTGRVGSGRLEVALAHRFANVPVRVLGTLHWDILRLYAGVIDGIRAAGREGAISSVGIDAWGVDYGLLDATGALLANPVHYRDERTRDVLPRVLERISAAELYAATGIQQLPINTLCQLVAAAGTPALQQASRLLLIPDLIAYWLTGSAGAEVTNASTTQLLDISTGQWATAVMERVGVPARLFPPLREPGERIGDVLPDVSAEIGLARPLPVTAVASHDTASAVAAVPASGRAFGYISCGTWSLVGMELDQPVRTDASRLANFTNERGLDKTVRFLRNVMGLWLLQESMRAWAAAGMQIDQDELAAAAIREPPLRYVIDPDNPAFLAPGDMPARIAAACRAAGQGAPDGPVQTARCILDSLALAYRRAIAQVQELSGQHADAVHLVGGGVRNAPLCQLTADACGLPVVAGPAEATAIGNMLVQARALGSGPGDLAGMRALVRGTQRLTRYLPSGTQGQWQEAQDRLPLL
ncbi:MAG TPA: rhamnulokinase family protein [Streptosporangiaceae bacterium]|nr:rhamnulokinase family protein [Streptosporangiaceae bacterium]